VAELDYAREERIANCRRVPNSCRQENRHAAVEDVDGRIGELL
jgi:hypothetical protein